MDKFAVEIPIWIDFRMNNSVAGMPIAEEITAQRNPTRDRKIRMVMGLEMLVIPIPTMMVFFTAAYAQSA